MAFFRRDITEFEVSQRLNQFFTALMVGYGLFGVILSSNFGIWIQLSITSLAWLPRNGQELDPFQKAMAYGCNTVDTHIFSQAQKLCLG